MNFTVPKILTPADIISLNLAPSTVAEFNYSGSTTYTAGQVVKVSYASNGTTLILPVKTYKALAETTLYPPDHSDPDNADRVWEDLGVVNQHKMFDAKIDTSSAADGTEATDPGKIVFKLNAGRQDKISLFNVEATKVTFELRNSGGDIVETAVHNLATQVGDLEEYFYLDFETRFDVIHPFISLLVSSITVIIEHEDAGLMPAVGFVLLGTDVYAGQELNEPSAGFSSFMTAEDFKTGGPINNYPSEQSIDLNVRIDTANLSKLNRSVAAVKDRATLWEGMDNLLEPFTTLGVLQGYQILFKDTRKSELNFQIGGIK